MTRSPTRKRPCRICKRWFMPHPRVKDRQKTCGNPPCQREWHRKMLCLSDQINYLEINEIDAKRGVVLGLRINFLIAKRWF